MKTKWQTDVIDKIVEQWGYKTGPEAVVEGEYYDDKYQDVMVWDITDIPGKNAKQKAKNIRKFLEENNLDVVYSDPSQNMKHIKVRRYHEAANPVQAIVSDKVVSPVIENNQSSINILETIDERLQENNTESLESNLVPESDIPLNCILCGPPGTGKTNAAKKLLEKIKNAKQYAEVCFHPATAYEDFIRAIQSDDKGNFSAINKVFGKICDEALDNPEKLYAILIDEINRANLPAVLGELMTALEYRGEPVNVPHEVKLNSSKREPGQLIVPKNLLVIGTMNTADRSTGHLDYALRRRFVFFQIKPKPHQVEDDTARNMFIEVLGLFYKTVDVKDVSYSKLKERSDLLAPEFEPDDVAIGHSYFANDNWEFRAKYQVAPLLEEYVRDGVLVDPEPVKTVIQKLKGAS